MARSFIGYYGFVGYNYFYYRFDSVRMRITLDVMAVPTVVLVTATFILGMIPFNANSSRLYDGYYGCIYHPRYFYFSFISVV